jgi:hypothetical protein
VKHTVRVERGPEGQPERYLTGHTHVAPPTDATQFPRGGREDLADGVVKLADAREAGGESHAGDGQVGRLDEKPRGVGAPGAGERERPGPDLGREQPVQMTLRVAEAPREAGHTLPVHDAVGDETHSPRDEIGPGVPLR